MSRRAFGDVTAARRYAAALAAYPRRRAPRLYFIRGWKAELGDAEARGALTGHAAEKLGAAAAREDRANASYLEALRNPNSEGPEF